MENRVTEMLEKRVDEKLSPGVKLALVLVAGSFRFGGNWAFIKETDSQYEGKLGLLMEEKGSIEGRRLDNGLLILMDKNFLTKNINEVVPNGINQKFIQESKEITVAELEKFKKFSKNVIEGKSRFLEDKGGYYDLSLGCYSMNDTNIIKVNGVERPAYKLGVDVILKELKELSKGVGKKILVKIKNEEGKISGIEIDKLDKSMMKYVYKGLEISDSMTGVFLTIRIQK